MTWSMTPMYFSPSFDPIRGGGFSNFQFHLLTINLVINIVVDFLVTFYP